MKGENVVWAVFEETVACNRSAQKVYLDGVRGCDVYLGILRRVRGELVPPLGGHRWHHRL